MSTSNDEIKSLAPTRWRTTKATRIERFSQLLDNQNIAAKFFGEKYVEQLSSKISRLFRTQLLLGVIYLVLMLSLFAAQETGKNEFEIFGYGFKNLEYHKELLLLIAASLTPISAMISGYHGYLGALREECLKKIAPIAEVREFYSNALIDNYAQTLAKRHDYRTSKPHLFAQTLAIALVSFMLLVLLALIAGSFLLQVSVIYDVATRPSTSPAINLFVVTYAVSAILLSWLISAMQLPLPEVDLSNYRKLSELQNSDPKKYEETMERLSREATSRENTWSNAIGFFISILTVSVLSISQSHDITANLAEFLARGTGAVFASLALTKPITDIIWKHMMRWLFSKYGDHHPNRFNIFKRLKWAMLVARMSIPTLISAAALLLQNHYYS